MPNVEAGVGTAVESLASIRLPCGSPGARMAAMDPRRALLLSTLALAAGLLPGPAAPLAAGKDGPYHPDEPLCQAMFRFAESARSHARSVKYRHGRGALATPECQQDGSTASRRLCELLSDRAARLAIPPLAQDALFCIGIGEPPVGDPDAIVLHSFYTTGTFASEPPHFADGKVRLEISLDGRAETKRPWIAVAAMPVN